MVSFDQGGSPVGGRLYGTGIGGDTMNDQEMRDCYYILRAMHDGACPSCGHMGEEEKFKDRHGNLQCPECHFNVLKSQIDRIQEFTSQVLKRRLESFHNFSQ